MSHEYELGYFFILPITKITIIRRKWWIGHFIDYKI